VLKIIKIYNIQNHKYILSELANKHLTFYVSNYLLLKFTAEKILFIRTASTKNSKHSIILLFVISYKCEKLELHNYIERY
jgi:hypothetical protein